jgi:hypothetical protein
MKLSNHLTFLSAFLITFSGFYANAEDVCADSEADMTKVTILDVDVTAWQEQPAPGQEDDGSGLIMKIYDEEGTLRMSLHKPNGPDLTTSTLWAKGPITLCRAENGTLSIRGRLSATRKAPVPMQIGLNGERTFKFTVINKKRFSFSVPNWKREFAPY